MLDILIVLVVEKLGVFVFVHVSLRWLVGSLHTQLLHLAREALLLQLFLFFKLQSFFLLLFKFFCFLFFLLLNAAELFEDVLIVKQSVSKFFFKDVGLQEALDSLFDGWHFENLVNSRSLRWVSSQHHADQVGNVAGKVCWQRLVLAGNDTLSQLMQRLCIERRLQGSHLVEKDAERPNIRLEVVALTLNDFG